MLQSIEVADRRAGLKPADLGLPKAQPLAEEGLRDAARAIDGIVVRVCAVGPGHPAHVLGSERLPELRRLPELGWNPWRGDELIAPGPSTAGALAPGVVLRQARTAAAVSVPCRS